MTDHHRTQLAANAIASIERCPCSTIHLTIGAITLRFTPDAFQSLASAICEAIGPHAALAAGDTHLLLARGQA